MKVAIVVLNWNRKKDTLECLESISFLNTESQQVSVIVVDNASTDNSVFIIKNFLAGLNKKRNWQCELLENKENLGFAAGNNVGIKHALNHEANYVLVLNNDTKVDKDLLINLFQTVKENSNVGLVSPKIYFAKGFEFHKQRYTKKDLGRVIWYAGGVIDWKNVFGLNRGVDEVDRGQYDKVCQTDFATGACLLMTKEAVKKVGMFDEKYYMYYEDVDFSLRIKKGGFRVLYCPKAYLWHKVAQSSAIGGELSDYFITRNRLLFGMRYAPIRNRFALYRESLRLFWKGRKWQKVGVRDFYLRRFGRGSWK